MSSKSVVVLLCGVVAQLYLLNAATLSGSKYIVGGTKAAFGNLPYVVALTAGEYATGIQSLFCAAALVSTKSILTAGHCVDVVYNGTDLISSVRATVGTNYWKSGGQTYELSHNATHPQYAVTKYDIAFLFTTTCVTLSYLVKPVPIDFDFVEPGVTAKAVGYGYTQINDTAMSDEIYELSVTVLDKETCLNQAAQITNDVINYDIEICTYHSMDHGTCYGDSGAPLVRTDEGTLIGCVSWGIPCAIGAPDLFTRFSAFKDWINKNIIDDCPKQKIQTETHKKLPPLLNLAKKYREKARNFLGLQK